MTKKAMGLTLLSVCLAGCSVESLAEEQGTLVELPDFVLYLPAHFDKAARHSAIFAFMPDGHAHAMIRLWRSSADKYQWVILASRLVTTQTPLNHYGNVVSSARDVMLKSDYAVDMSRVVLSGFSGGARMAHEIMFDSPGLFAGVVANTGMIDESILNSPQYPRGKYAVFLASPPDFRYGDMQKDKVFLDSLGWKTHWLEFPGGHGLARVSDYEAAAQWLDEQFKQLVGGDPANGSGQ